MSYTEDDLKKMSQPPEVKPEPVEHDLFLTFDLRGVDKKNLQKAYRWLSGQKSLSSYQTTAFGLYLNVFYKPRTKPYLVAKHKTTIQNLLRGSSDNDK